MSEGTGEESALKKLGSEVPKQLSKDAGKTAIDLEVDKQVVPPVSGSALPQTRSPKPWNHLDDYYDADEPN